MSSIEQAVALRVKGATQMYDDIIDFFLKTREPFAVRSCWLREAQRGLVAVVSEIFLLERKAAFVVDRLQFGDGQRVTLGVRFEAMGHVEG